MNSLTKTANLIRRIALIFLVTASIILAIDFVVKLIESAPQPLPPSRDRWLFADEGLGTIPPPKMDSIAISNESTPIFAVEGDFPTGPEAPSTVLTYSVKPPIFSLGSEDQAIDTAEALGFFAEYEQEQRPTGSQLFTWEREGGVRQLSYEILPNKFERWRLITQFNFDASAQRPKSVNSDTSFYANRVSDILSTLGFSETSLNRGIVDATPGKLGADGLLRQPVSLTSADYVDIQVYHELEIARPSIVARDLGYQPINGRVYRNNPRVGSLSMTVSDDLGDITNDIYNIDYRRFSIDQSDLGSYYIVSFAEAWERIRRGEGSLTLLQLQPFDRFRENQPGLNINQFTADADSTKLGFFIPDEWDGNLYPIYIFQGRVDTADGRVGRFTFFVDALERF